MVWRNIFTIAGGSTVFGDSQQKRDPRIKVKCHLCDFPFKKKEKRANCYCRKNVHVDCFKGDGYSCPAAP